MVQVEVVAKKCDAQINIQKYINLNYFFVVSFGRLSFYLCFLFYYVALLPIVDPCAAAVFFFYLLLRLVMQFNVFEAVR